MRSRQSLKWPENLKKTAARVEWFEKFSRLDTGLGLGEVARLMGEHYGAVRRWALMFGYSFPDQRRAVLPQQWAKVNWLRRDADIARSLGVTRECVRLVRKTRGVGPSAAQAAIRNLERFVSSNRRKLHGLLVEEVIAHSATDLPYHVVRRVLRENRVRPHQVHSRLRDVDWRLPNRDLAGLWGTSARYIANLRARLRVGPSKWSARRHNFARTKDYTAALDRERQKALTHRRTTERGRIQSKHAVLV